MGKLSRLRDSLSYEQLRLRKWTTLIHWVFGVICGVVAVQCFPAGITLLLMFAGFEAWNDWCDCSKRGAADWWESFLTFCIVFSVAIILHIAGIITIGWWF